MKKSVKIALIVFFIFVILYGLMDLTSILYNIISKPFDFLVLAEIVLCLLLLVSGFLGIFYSVTNNVKKAASAIALPAFFVFLSTSSSAFSLMISGIPTYSFMFVICTLFEVAILIGVIISYFKMYKALLIIEIVSYCSLAFIYFIAFLGLLVIPVTPLFIACFILMVIMIILGIITASILFSNKRSLFGEETSKSIEPQSAPANSSQPQEGNVAEKLKELKSLFDSGIITEEEYEEKRKQYVDKL